MFKFDLDSINGTKNWGKVFYFLDNCIWIISGKVSQYWREYLLSAANVLTKTPKISYINKGDILQTISPTADEKIW